VAATYRRCAVGKFKIGFVQLVKKGKSRNFDAFLKKDPPPKKQMKKRLRRFCLCPYQKY
jgi:hypothetical protein